MPSCDVCGEELPATATLTCDDCGGGFCREHYHSHECDPVPDEEPAANPPTSRRASRDRSSAVATLGYALGAILGVIGLGYFVRNFELVLYGSEGVDAIQALVSLGISGAFFSFATFVLVGSYILAQA